MTSLIKHLQYIKEVVLYTDTRIAVLLISINNIYWAVDLYLPQEVLFRPFYQGLYDISPNETLWGTIFLTLGLTRLYRLLIVDEVNQNLFYSVFDYVSRLLSCFITTYIFFTAAIQPISPPVAGDTMIMALIAWWDFFRYDKTSYRKLYMKITDKRGI